MGGCNSTASPCGGGPRGAEAEGAQELKAGGQLGGAGGDGSVEDAVTLEPEEPEDGALSALAAASLASVPWKDQEANQWLNKAIARLWPMVVKVATKEVKEKVDQGIKDNLPDWIDGHVSFEQFALGMEPPEISRIETTETPTGLKIQLGFDIESGVDLAFSVGIIKVGISKLKVSGDVTILLEPLIGEAPLVGAVKIYCVDPPDLDYSFSGVAAVNNLPIIKQGWRLFIDKMIASLIVIPNFQTVQLVKFDKQDFSDGLTEPIGVLRVRAVSAKGLTGSDWHLFGKSKSDPFLKIKLGDKTWRTSTVKGTTSPKWPEDETYDFIVYDKSQVLFITVWDDDSLNSDDRLGQPVPMQVADAIKQSGMELPIFEKAKFIRRGAPYTEGPGKGELIMNFSWLERVSGDVNGSRDIQSEGYTLEAEISTLTVPARFSQSVQVRLKVADRKAESQHVKSSGKRLQAAIDGVDKAIIGVVKRGSQLGHSAKTLSAQTGLSEAVVTQILKEKELAQSKNAIADKFVAAKVQFNARLAMPLRAEHVQPDSEMRVEIRSTSGAMVAHGIVKLKDVPVNAPSLEAALVQLTSDVDGTFALRAGFSLRKLKVGASC